MHTAIIFTVEAEDKAQALDYVSEFAHETSWSDWNELGGRWADLTEGAILKYSDNPEKFMELVEMAKGWYNHFISRALQEVGHLTIRELVEDPRYDFASDWSRQESLRMQQQGASEDERRDMMTRGLSKWQARRVLNVISGDFQPETGWLDLGVFSELGDATDLEERIKDNPDRQFLVVWDFHH